MPQRFYLAELPDTGTVILDGLEAHHLIHVLRAKPGEVVELFNGSGLVAKSEVTAVRRRDVELRVLESQRVAAPPLEVILGTAVPKGDRVDWLIEKATELGVTRVVPLITARSVVDPRDGKLDKLRQTVIAACKQSGRNHLLEISPVTPWRDFVKTDLALPQSFIAHPGADALSISSLGLDGQTRVAFAIGPEGGFTNEEVALAISVGAKPFGLGPFILRIETAALAAVAMTLN